MRHWGEMSPEVPEVTTNINAVIEKAMDKLSVFENDFSDEPEKHTDHSIIMTTQDPLVVYAISLHKHITHMTEIIRLADLAIESNVTPSEDAAPPVPLLKNVEFKHRFNCLNFLPKEETDFTCGNEVQIPVLSEIIVRKLLRRSICTLFAHLGYQSSHESVINILEDVLKEFYKLFCSKLEHAVWDENKNGSCGFPNVIEKVLVELGLGGVKGLHDFYMSRVVKYVNVLRARCQQLNNDYNKLLIKKNQSLDPDSECVAGFEIRKEEIEENPEVHLLDGEIEFSSLETGFQLLNSLEEANLQNLIEEQDILTTESSGNNSSEVEYFPTLKKNKKL